MTRAPDSLRWLQHGRMIIVRSVVGMVALFTAFHLVLVAVSTASQENVPLPRNLQITEPRPTLPAELRALSGKWYGLWDDQLEHILVVEEIISPDEVIFIYAHGTASQWNINKPGWGRFKGKFDSGGLKGTLRGGVVVTYRLQPDDTISAIWESRQHRARGVEENQVTAFGGFAHMVPCCQQRKSLQLTKRWTWTR